MSKYMERVELKNIKITDQLFKEYVGKVSSRILPHQWKILNDQLEDSAPTGCIRNFRIAAGELEGERQGVVFLDTDLYKWLEAVAYCLEAGQGRENEALADEVIGLIGRAQEPDGYLNTYFTVKAPERKWKNLLEGHELYTSGHMMEAAAAYYHATGKDTFLNIAGKNADLICRIFGTGEGQIPGYPGHQEVELGLIKLYRATGERRYLDQADYFIRQRGKEPNYLLWEKSRRQQSEFFPELNRYDLEYSQAHMEPIRQKTAEGHAVRAMYMCAAMADLAAEYEDEEMKAACMRIWENAVGKRMYITGGIGSSGYRERFTTDYDLPNSTNYSETCASIGLMMFGQRMTDLTGEAGYYDTVERALYNTVLAGINMEGDRYFYVNPLEVVPEFCTEHTYMDHVKPVRQKWFSVACCPPNVARTLASLGQYIYAVSGDAVYIHQFISSEAETVAGNGRVSIKMTSCILQDGTVTIQAETEKPVKLNVRIPWYAGKWKVCLNGKPVGGTTQKGYCIIALEKGSSSIEVDFDIEARWMAADDRVRADAGKVALMRGPMVYCLEEKDNGNLLSEIYVEEKAPVQPGEPDPQLAGNIPTLHYPGIRIRNKGVRPGELYGSPDLKREAVSLKAVPYALWNNRGPGELLVWHKLRI